MKTKYIKWLLFILALFVLIIAAVLLSLSIGEMSIALSDIPSILASKDGVLYIILSKIRIPRIVLAFAVGGSLSLAGVILQGVYRNPLVEPYTLGISGGAAFGVALVIVTGLQYYLGSFMLPLAGFAGAFAAIVLVYFLSLKKGAVNVNRMLLIGVMISFVASSSMMFLMAITTSENLHGIVFWMMGSVEEPNASLIRLVLITSFVGLFISYIFARPLNALRLGQEKAQHLGVDSKTTVQVLFVISSLLTGICVAVAGIIGFVGLIIPHMVKLIIGNDYRILLLTSFLGGGFFLIISDVIARTVIAPNELPIGVITGMIGGLIFIVVLARTRKTEKFS